MTRSAMLLLAAAVAACGGATTGGYDRTGFTFLPSQNYQCPAGLVFADHWPTYPAAPSAESGCTENAEYPGYPNPDYHYACCVSETPEGGQR